MVSSGGFFSSSLFSLYNVVQNTQILYPKELIISTLRNYFSKDVKYHYVSDEWGFPKIPDHTNLNPKAGLQDNLTTRIYIGQEAKFDVKFYPAILIKNTKTTYVPISFNQEEECLEYEKLLFDDGYGNHTYINSPVNFIVAGSWDLGFDLDVLTEGPQDRSTIVENVCILLQSIARNHLTDCGLFIKNVSAGGETFEIYQNDNIYKQTISLDCRGEFKRTIPITNVIDSISMCIEIGNIAEDNTFSPAPNLQINYDLDLTNTILQRFSFD
jgi:hypothetical protein